jgi:leader peptidase (prepilin peptidase)/N-methyltransferase
VQLTASHWWWIGGAAAAGLVLGAVASGLTRRFLRRERRLAGAWWFGAVLTAAALGLLGWRVGARGELAVYGFVTVLAVPLAVIDWCEHRLPRALMWPQLAGALAGFALLCLAHHDPVPGVRSLAAMAGAGAFFLVLAVATGGGVGAGDVSAAAVVGLVIGWIGWPQVAAALIAASVFALAVVSVPGAGRRDGNGGTVVPFGPCLLTGALVMVLVGG